MNIETPVFSAGERCRVEFKLHLPLVDGHYDLGADVAAADLSHYYDRLEQAMTFHIEGPGKGKVKGLVDLGARVSFHRQPGRNGSGEQSRVPETDGHQPQ
jgi:hypothetical protein